MDNDRVASALRDLGNSESRTEAARLREVFPHVEAALAAGVSRNAILDTLHEQGFKMNLKTFDNAIYRLRKKAASGAEKKATLVSTMPAPARIPAGQEKETHVASENQTNEEQTEIPLTPREKREKRAAQFIKPESSNPLLKSLKGKGQL